MKCKHCGRKIKSLYSTWVIDLPLDEKARVIRDIGSKEVFDMVSKYCRYDAYSVSAKYHQPSPESIIDQLLIKYQ